MPVPAFAVANLSDERRVQLAWQAHESLDRRLPTLSAWNYEPCRFHRNGWEDTITNEDGTTATVTRPGPNPRCRQCAIIPRKHQRVGGLWLYLVKKGLLADTMGLGKTTQAGLLIALLHESGELSYKADPRTQETGRVVIVPRAPALAQWRDELLRMMPGLDLLLVNSEMTKAQRHAAYLGQWKVLLMGPEMFRNDHDGLRRMPISTLITDDIDPLRNPNTDTSVFLDNFGRRLDRYVIMSGTPLQKRLMEMHAVLDGVGGEQRLGTRDYFEKRHVRFDKISSTNPRTGRIESTRKEVGFRDLDEVKRRMAPIVLRRTAADLDDLAMPTIIPEDVYLDLYPRQRAAYEELRRNVIRLLKEDGAEVTKRVNALSKIHYGAAICAGLTSLGEPDGPGQSVKFDWTIDKVTGDLNEEKIVVFAKLKTSVRALQYRLREEGVGFVTVWGEEKRPSARKAAQDKFWDDPNCRVLLGTTAIEQSLNLQVSRHLVNVDTIMNQARMAQLAGRIARAGSGHGSVFVHNLLTTNTQEERYMALLEREAALAGYVMGDSQSQLFRTLRPEEFLALITG